MNINEIKKIPIGRYLSLLGHIPVINHNYYAMYRSPFRKDRTPSLKVDYKLNLWYDFGSGEGGSIIDLVMKMENCPLNESIDKLEKRFQGIYNTYCLRQSHLLVSKPQIVVTNVQPLSNTALVAYLVKRKINIDIARAYCPEIYYDIRGKIYYAIGFRNDSGGYELRNPYFKGSTSKDITTLKARNRQVNLFEGFMDFLSYLTYNQIMESGQNTIVLNSICNLDKVIEILPSFDGVFTYLDNDQAGELTLNKIKKTVDVCNKSNLYGYYKDFNEFLCRQSHNGMY